MPKHCCRVRADVCCRKTQYSWVFVVVIVIVTIRTNTGATRIENRFYTPCAIRLLQMPIENALKYLDEFDVVQLDT